MKKDLTEIVFILDRSGSMASLESDTIGGFNAFINKQKKEKGTALVSTVLFDDVSEVIHDRVDINDIKPLTEDEYFVRGCTALLDALGSAVSHIHTIHKYAREEDVPEKTIFVIITDGYENASKYYSYNKVKEMIEKRKKEDDWQFLFLGANIDALETASRFGIDKQYACNYCSDTVGTKLNFTVVSDAVGQLRTNKFINKNWKDKIDEDYNKRGKK